MLSIDLTGKTAFVAGIGDDQGYGWAIARSLADAGCRVLVGVWPPVLQIFTGKLEQGRFDANRVLSNGKQLEFVEVFPLDAAFDHLEQVPEEVRNNKRYVEISSYTISDVAKEVEEKYGKIDILVHSLANGPEVKKPLLETSREGYLAAMSASSYSFVSLVQNFGPIMKEGGAVINLTYLAADRTVPGYGGGMSSAKAALQSDTRTLAYEAGRKWKIRINSISAGPLGSRAAKAIGFIGKMIDFSAEHSPIQREMKTSDVGNTACFLCSPLAVAITGAVVYVDNGLNTLAVPVE